LPNLPEVIVSYISAYNSKDVDAMLSCLSEDIRFQNYSNGKLTAETSDKRSFEEMAKLGALAFSVRKQTLTNAITVTDMTAVEIDYAAVVALDLPNGWKAGQEIALKGASLFRVCDGKISSIVDQS
jgi:ketosteroid isomerase-like protein